MLGDMTPAVAVPILFSTAFGLLPLAVAQATAVLSDLAPRPAFDGLPDPHAVFLRPLPWSGVRWFASAAFSISFEIFTLSIGVLALGLHRYRCQMRACEIGLDGRIVAWFATSTLPGLSIIHLLTLARGSGYSPTYDAFTLLAVVIVALVVANWWLMPRLRFGLSFGLTIFIIGVPALVIMLGTSAGTLLLFAPGSEFTTLSLLGPMVVLLIALSFVALGFGLTAAISRRRRVPIFAGTVSWMVALACFDLNDNHPVRLQLNAQLASAARAVRDDDSLWINDGEWPAILARWQHSTLPNGDKRPIVLVSAEGGGIRAAYFTAAALGRIADKCPLIAREMLAVSGISGGSLGAAAYAMAIRTHPLSETDNRCDFSVRGRGYYEAGLSRVFRHDLLSPVVAHALFPDLAQRLIPFPIDSFDRQLGLELALRAAFKQEFKVDSFAASMGQPVGSYRIPFLVVGATSVNSGNQKLFSEYDQVPYKGGRLQAFNLASIVASSARFPLISPPGHFYGDLGEVRNKQPVSHKIQLVDGGYYDNSGAYALTEILDRINYYRHHDSNGDRTDTPPLDPDTPVVWIRIINSPDCITGYPSRYLDALCKRQKEVEQHPTFGLEELLSPLKAVSAARTAKERITILATRQLLDERNEVEKSRDFEIDIQMAPIEDDIPLGWYLSARSSDSLSWQLSAKENSQCSLNADDSALASCALERIQYLVHPQGAGLARINTDLADFLFGYDGMQHASCEFAYRGQPNAAAAIAACDKADRLPTAYCLETPLHPTACGRLTSNHTSSKWFAPGN